MKRVTSTAFTKDLKKEADLLNQLRHQNIVAFVETFEEDGQLFVVLELCEGKFFSPIDWLGGDLYKHIPQIQGKIPEA